MSGDPDTAWTVSNFGGILFRIFSHSDTFYAVWWVNIPFSTKLALRKTVNNDTMITEDDKLVITLSLVEYLEICYSFLK